MKAKQDIRIFLKEQNLIQEKLTENPIVLSIVFIFKKPKHMRKAKVYPSQKDLTNCQKMLEDAFTGYIYKDDRQVVSIISSKLWGEEDGVFAEVFELDGDNQRIMDLTEIFGAIDKSLRSIKSSMNFTLS